MRTRRAFVPFVALVLLLACGTRSTPPVLQPRVAAVDPFLEDLERKTFEWFWDTTNASNGLVPDRWPDINFSSIAAIGFGLTAYGVGAERGYVTREQARDRTLTTLRFLWNAPQTTRTEGRHRLSRLLLSLPGHGEGAPLPDGRAVRDRHGIDDGGRVVRAVLLRSGRRRPSARFAISPTSCTGASSGAGCSRGRRSSPWRGSRRAACTPTTTRATKRR